MEKSNILNKIDKEKAIKIAHVVYAVLLIALAVAVGVLFIVNVVDIYDNGATSPFTVSAIESHFKAIAPAVIAFPCLVVLGFVLHFVFPLETKAQKTENISALITLSQKVNLDKVSEESKKSIVRERYFRLGSSFGSALIWIIALVIILVFTLSATSYQDAKVNEDVKDLALVVFSSSLVAIAVSFGVSISNKLSKKRELALLKSAIKEDKSVMDGCGKSGLLPIFDNIFSIINKIKGFMSKNETISVWAIRGVFLTLAIVFIALVIVNGGMDDVFAKAVRICTECIGLG